MYARLNLVKIGNKIFKVYKKKIQIVFALWHKKVYFHSFERFLLLKKYLNQQFILAIFK